MNDELILLIHRSYHSILVKDAYMAAKNHGVIAPIKADKIRIAIQMNAVLPGRGSFRSLGFSTLLKLGRGLTDCWVILEDTGMLSGVLETAIVILPF